MTNDGWDDSAAAWIARQGSDGDWGRRCVLDPALLGRIGALPAARMLDVGCGEGRFCRLLAQEGWNCTGIDPTQALIHQAKTLGDQNYVVASAEQLPFADQSFELVVAYLSLIDIPDFRTAIHEMNRVLCPEGVLLIANMNSFNTAGQHLDWVKDAAGQKAHYPVVDYMTERSDWVEWSGIRIQNWHRPLSAYFQCLLACDLRLTWFDEPPAINSNPVRTADYHSAPYFHAMEWKKS